MAYEFRARGVGELVDASFRLYRAHWWTMVKTAGVLLLPIGIVQALLQTWIRLYNLRFQTGELSLSGIPGFFFGAIGLSLLSQLIASAMAFANWISGAAVIEQAHAACRDDVVSFGAGWRAVRERLGRVIGAGAIITAMTMAAGYFTICCCGLGGLALAVYLSALMPIVMIELAPIGTALQRSFKMVGKNYWHVAAVQLVIVLIIAVPIILLVLAGVTLAGFLSAKALAETGPGFASSLPAYMYLVFYLSFALYSALVGPLYTIGSTLTYFDLRVRQEGYDLEQAAISTGLTAGGNHGAPLG